MAPEVRERLRAMLLAQERPRIADVLRELRAFCEATKRRCPSRATVYSALLRVEGHRHAFGELPASVRAALYNLDEDAVVPGAQVAFACFHFGDLAALSFAAGLPWLDLYQAGAMRGWRPKSRGLYEAVARVRGI